MNTAVIVVCGECGQKNRVLHGTIRNFVCGRCKIDLLQNGWDPASLFTARKAIFDTVQKAQLREHEALNRMGEITILRKRQLLVILSDWLLAITDKTYPTRHCSDLAHAAGISLSEWQSLQGEAVHLESELATAFSEERESETAYRSKASLGKLSEWIADEQGKNAIRELESLVHIKRAARRSLESQIMTNKTRRQEVGEQFLRNCLQNLDAVREHPAIGSRAAEHIEKMSDELRDVWATLEKDQATHIEALASYTERMRGMYR